MKIKKIVMILILIILFVMIYNIPTEAFEYNGFNAIGTIEIPKTIINYPILEFPPTIKKLDTSIVAAYPENKAVNTPGNIVLMGHNYKDGRFFSNNKLLSNGDKIYITGLDNKKVEYEVYKIVEMELNDTSVYNRDTEVPEITLITTTDDANQMRLIVLAKKVGEVENQNENNTNEDNESVNEKDNINKDNLVNNEEKTDANESNVSDLVSNEEQTTNDNTVSNKNQITNDNTVSNKNQITNDNTVSSKVMPKTGKNNLIFIMIILIICIFMFICYKNIKYE